MRHLDNLLAIVVSTVLIIGCAGNLGDVVSVTNVTEAELNVLDDKDLAQLEKIKKTKLDKEESQSLITVIEKTPNYTVSEYLALRSFRIGEVAENHLLVNATAALLFLGMNKATLESLPADVQELIRTKYSGPEIGARASACWKKLGGGVAEDLKAAGHVFTEVSADDLARIARRLVELAQDGDLAAAKVLFSYTLGPPQPAVNPDSVDANEAHLTLQRHFAFKQIDHELALAEGRVPTALGGFDVTTLSDAELIRRLTALYDERP